MPTRTASLLHDMIDDIDPRWRDVQHLTRRRPHHRSVGQRRCAPAARSRRVGDRAIRSTALQRRSRRTRLLAWRAVHAATGIERGSFNGVRSVVLTTLLGLQVTELNSLTPGRYSNIPTALVNIIEDLDRFLQAQGTTKPHLANPNGDGTNFDHRWTDETYRNFRDRIHTIAADLRAAYDGPDTDRSITAWRKVLGDNFNPPTAKRTGASTNPYVAAGSTAGIAAASRSGRSG